MSRVFTSRYSVYYEDTDAAGVVYYANYLKFAERARTDALRSLGIYQQDMLAKEGIGFVVYRLEVEYHASAQLDDVLTVETILLEMRKVRMTMEQTIKREGMKLATLRVEVVLIGRDRKPQRFPEALVQALEEK